MRMRTLVCTILLGSMALLAGHAARARQGSGTVKGTVRNEDRLPVAGVSITITDAKAGFRTSTRTDSSGQYSIGKLPAGTYRIAFSSIGYTERAMPGQVVAAGAVVVLDVSLTKSVSGLDDVVVIGYQSVRRRDVTSSVSSVTGKDLKDFPVSTAAEALAGKLAGVAVRSSEGAPGADIQIIVRGGTSITQDNAPLYIVDGVPLDNALSIISPGEIASIDVLKDVASTAIYGARGANGVVIITTKSGKPGKTTVSFDTYAGVRKITNYIDMMRPYDYVWTQYHQNNIHWSGSLSTDTASINGFKRRYGNVEDFDIYKSFPTVNWLERVFGRAAFSNTQIVSINGGTKGNTYNFSVNRTAENGIMLGSSLARTFATFRWDNEISKTFKVGVNVRYSNQMVKGAGTSVKGSNGGLQNSAKFQPYEGVSNLQQVNEDALFESRIDLSTPVTAATRDQRLNRNADLITSGYVNINIMKGLTFRTNIGYRVGENTNNAFRGVVNYEVSSFSNFGNYKDQPFVDMNRGRTVGITNTNTLNYNVTIKKDHRIDLLLGQETNQTNSDSYTQNIKYFPSNVTWEEAFANVQQANAPQGFIQAMPVSNVQSERLFSYFARGMYTYKSRYILNLSVRRDGSSKFGPDNRWSTFPSAQFAWRLSEEPFMQPVMPVWANGIKFRLSYGTAGNNRVGTDRLYATIYATSPSAGGYAENDNSQTSGLYPTQYENPHLKWETTISRNVGLDIDLMNSAFNLTVDLYSNKTRDLLLNTNIPQQNGYSTQTQNIGETKNEGIEFQLSYQMPNARKFRYNTSFNISFNRNTVLKLNQGGEATYGYGASSGWGAAGEDFWVQVGQPVGQYYGYVVDGFYTMADFDRKIYEADLASNGKRTWTLNAGVPSSGNIIGQGVFPGALKLKDLTGDGLITVADKKVLGTYQPKFFGGWSNQFAYGGFDLSTFINFSFGNKTYNANRTVLGSLYQVNGNNLLQQFSQSWKYFYNDGTPILKWDDLQATNANVKTYSPVYGPMIPLSDAIEDASFLRITNLTVGYTIPAGMLKRIKATNLRIYATVNNLYTFTNYTGFDPEANTRSSPLTPGVDYSAYPRSRYILAGLNLTF